MITHALIRVAFICIKHKNQSLTHLQTPMSVLWNLVSTGTSVSILMAAMSALISMNAHKLTAVMVLPVKASKATSSVTI